MAAVLRRKPSQSSRRRIAAVSFLSNISLDGTYKDTKLTLLSGNNFVQKKTEYIPGPEELIAEEYDIFQKTHNYSTSAQVKRSDLDITKNRFKKAKNTDAHSLSSDSDCVITPTRLGVDDSNRSSRERSDGKKEGHSRKRTTSGNRPLSSFGDGLDPFISLGIERSIGQETSYGYLLVPTRRNDDARCKYNDTIDDTVDSTNPSASKGKRLPAVRRLSFDPETDNLNVAGSPPPEDSVCNPYSYQPDLLDNPNLVSEKHRTQQSFSSYMTSVIDNFKPSDMKKEINDKFKEKFPHIELTLTKLRSLKREMRKIAKMENNMDLVTVAQAYVYFEKLVLKGIINKQNRKLCAGASLILSAKLNDVKGDALRGLFDRTENTFRLNRKEMIEVVLILAASCEHVEPWKLYAKKEYNQKVKTDSYEIDLQARPFDNDIRSPKLDWFLPHYRRLGYDEHLPWISETHHMLSQPLAVKETSNPDKKFLSYYTYHDELNSMRADKGACPSPFAVNEYITTMQNSYKPQRGYITERLAMAETPFFVNRRFRIENRRESRNKFWDDDHLQEIQVIT